MAIKIVLPFLLLCILAGCLSAPDQATPASSTVLETVAPQATATPTATPTLLPTVRIHNAEDLLFAGDYKPAITQFEITFQTSTERDIQAAALKGLSLAYIKMNDCESALTYLTTIEDQYTDTNETADAYYLAGTCYEALQQYPQAIRAYQSYLDLEPGLLSVLVNEKIGDLQFNLLNYPDSILYYTRALEQAAASQQDTIRMKIARVYKAQLDYPNAVALLWEVYNKTGSDYTKAAVNLELGLIYLLIGEEEQAYARYLDSVANFPRSYDSYTQLVELVNNQIAVPDLDRGIVDYYAGQYGYAIDAIVRYINLNPEHAGEAHFFLGISYLYIAEFDNALAQYDQLILDHPEDRFWTSAWDEKAYLLWHEKNQFAEAAQVLLDYVARIPDSTSAADFLFEAGRIYERGNLLDKAAATWQRIIDEYPQSDTSLRALFLAGISLYRLADYDQALLIFQRYIVLTDASEEQSSAHFWMGKIHQKQNDPAAAQESWRLAQSVDPTGYYGIRSAELLTQKASFESSPALRLAVDAVGEKIQAEYWLRQTFNIPAEADLADLNRLSSYTSFNLGDQYYALGMYEEASAEFSTLSQQITLDGTLSYILMNHLLDLHLYRQAIVVCRQILNLVFTSDEATFSAPAYFNHIRFGLYFSDLVDLAAENYGFDPLYVYSLIRQESLFEGHAVSSAGAIGLMQIMPATGSEIASNLNWPTGFTISDLERPVINIPMGVSYLARQRDYFNSDLVVTLAAYNGGPGNALAWQALAGGDPDLFVEVIRYDETRQYIQQITENFWIYQQLYGSR